MWETHTWYFLLIGAKYEWRPAKSFFFLCFSLFFAQTERKLKNDTQKPGELCD